MVRGRSELFRHRDVNWLVKVAEPQPNPLLPRPAAKKAWFSLSPLLESSQSP